MPRLLVSGWRLFDDEEIIRNEIFFILGFMKLKSHDRDVCIREGSQMKDVTLILGDCKGVDTVSGRIAASLGWKTVVYVANWNLGLKAGPIRNKRMVENGKPDFAICFLSKESKGTKNMINLLRNVRTYIVNLV